MTNTHKYPKFIAIASHHNSPDGKLWSFVALDNTTEKLAIAEGVRKGFAIDDPFCIHIAKKVWKQDGKQVYKSFLRVYRDGVVHDTSTELFAGWQVSIDDIIFE